MGSQRDLTTGGASIRWLSTRLQEKLDVNWDPQASIHLGASNLITRITNSINFKIWPPVFGILQKVAHLLLTNFHISHYYPQEDHNAWPCDWSTFIMVLQDGVQLLLGEFGSLFFVLLPTAFVVELPLKLLLSLSSWPPIPTWQWPNGHQDPTPNTYLICAWNNNTSIAKSLGSSVIQKCFYFFYVNSITLKSSVKNDFKYWGFFMCKHWHLSYDNPPVPGSDGT